MKIAVIGASGFTGKAVVTAALNQGHKVYAISRSGKFEQHDNLNVIHEDVNNWQSLAEKLEDIDVIVSNFNSGWQNPRAYEDFITGSKATIQLAKLLDKHIIITIGASSLYDTNSNQQIYYNAPSDFQKMVKGAFDLYHLVINDYSFKWTLVSPPLELTEEKSLKNYNIGGNYVLYNQDEKSTVSIYDLADLLVKEATKPVNLHQRITLANR